MIWLVDYTYYNLSIDAELSRQKRDYFQIKTYKRATIIGETAPIKTRPFATGLLRLATILDRNGISVRYLSHDMLQQCLDNCDTPPQIVAFSSVTPTVPRCAKLAQQIKTRFPQTIIKIGGVHVTYNAEETLCRFPIFDEACIGYEHEAAERIAGVSLKKVADIYIDYSLLPLPLHEYAINTFSTLGCPFSCSYCMDRLSPHFTAQPDGNLGVLKKLLPKRNLVHFFDSVLGFSPEGIRKTCAAIQATEHEFILSCDMRADMLTPELLQCLSKAGFKEIRMGVESADEVLLKNNGRTLTAQKFHKQIQMIREHSDLYLTLYSITGLPGTTQVGQQKTLEYFDELFQKKLVDEIKNALYVPYPMKGLDYKARGVYVTNEDWACYDRQSFPVYHTDNFDEQTIWELYVTTAKSINESWLRSLGFSSYKDIPDLKIPYSEYVIRNYLNDNKGDA